MALNHGSTTLLMALGRRTLPLLFIQVVVTAIFCMFVQNFDLSLGSRGAMDRGDVRTLVPEGGESLLLAILVVSVNALFSIGTVVLQHSDSKSLRVGLPIHVYLLPLTFRRMATVHMVYGVVAVGLVTWIAAALAARFLSGAFASWQPAVLAMTVYAIAQAWALVFGGRRRPVGALVGFVACGAGLILAMRNETVVGVVSSVPGVAAGVGVLVVGIILLEISIRLGRENRFRAFEGASDMLSDGSGVKTRKPFSSAYWTQAWYEWRTTGWVLPCLVVSILALYFVVVPLFTGLFVASTDTRDPLGEGFATRFAMQWANNQHIMVTGILSSAGGAGVLTGAYLFLVSGEWRQKSTFLRTRPLRTDQLAWVRLTVLFSSTACATAILMVTYGVINIVLQGIDPQFDYLLHQRVGFEHIHDYFVVAFFAGTLFMIMWTGLWIVNASFGLSVFGALSVVGMLLTALLIRSSDLAGDHIAFYYIQRAPVWLAAALWIMASITMYRRAYSDRVIPSGARRWAGVLWVSYTVPFLYYGMGIRYYATILDENGNILHGVRVTDLNLVAPEGIPLTHPVDWVLWAGLSLFPILPFVTLPYRLNEMRHD
ncbi:MAG: hypothetical protein VCD00_18315 [Candidatus Hydrogenedentota bacterium]